MYLNRVEIQAECQQLFLYFHVSYWSKHETVEHQIYVKFNLEYFKIPYFFKVNNLNINITKNVIY